MPNIQIMIADIDQAQIDAVSAQLTKLGGFDVISTVTARENAIKQLSAAPDIMLLNPEILKGHTLLRFIHAIQAKSPHTRVISLLRKPVSDDEIIADMKTGIRGYVKSTDSSANLARAIQSVQTGEIWAERRILEKAIANPMLLPETLSTMSRDLFH